MSNGPREQVPGVFHRRVGDIVVTAISDGYLDGSIDVLRNITQDEATKILAESFRPARRTAVNAFLVYSAGRLALIETGSGHYLLPTASIRGRSIRCCSPTCIRIIRPGCPIRRPAGATSTRPSWWCTRTSRAT